MSVPAEPPAAPAPPACPARRPRKDGTLPRLDHCLNCGTPTGDTDNFCPRCGQENQNETVGLRPLVSDVLAEMASWDSKLVRTVIPLLLKPGALTVEYNAGRRVRYLSPLKMYLVISALFFLALPSSNVVSHIHTQTVKPPPGFHANVSTKTLGKSQDVSFFTIDDNGTERDNLPATLAAYDAQQKDPRNPHKDGLFKSLIARQIIKARGNEQTFAQSVIQNVFDDLPKMMFALLPLFALLLKMTYWRSKRLYVEHLIFSLHSHAFAFALLTVPILLSRFAPNTSGWDTIKGVVTAVVFVLLPVYLFVALRRVYGQGRGKTFLKINWIAFNYFILLVVAFSLTAIIAVLLA